MLAIPKPAGKLLRVYLSACLFAFHNVLVSNFHQLAQLRTDELTLYLSSIFVYLLSVCMTAVDTKVCIWCLSTKRQAYIWRFKYARSACTTSQSSVQLRTEITKHLFYQIRVK